MSHDNLHDQALALLERGDLRAAMACLDRALALQPRFADAWLTRGNILQRVGALRQSIASYQEAIRLRPDLPAAYNNLAAAQRAARQPQQALASVGCALQLRPAYPMALNNRGLVQLDLGHASAAIEDFRRAVALEPRFPDALHNLGTALLRQQRYPEACDAFAQLAAIAPAFPHVSGNLLLARMHCCDWDGYEPALAAVCAAVARGEHAIVPMHLLNVCDSPALQLACARLYTGAHYPPRTVAPAAQPAATHDRIRIAYLSGDLGEHAVTYLLAGVLERHDPAQFETIAFSWGRSGTGPARARIERAFARFIDVTGSGDEDVAQLMRELGVDIAVDLCGHTLGQRTGILARRPAPVQVNFLGFPATMGAPYIDYLIADRWLVPESQAPHYAERLVLMPGCFQPNDGTRVDAAGCPARAGLGLPDDGFVFCAFNRNTKMTPACFDAWMRLLQAVPGSVLWLLATHPIAQDHLRRQARHRGIDAARLVFAAELPYADYLARFRAADLFLDTFPFNGGATVADALSMGLPVLTCAGQGFAARMAGSILTGLGLAPLVTQSLAEYEAVGIRLARNPAALSALRRDLGQRRTSHPYFDPDRYRCRLEAAYRAMWQRHAAGLAPADIVVPGGDDAAPAAS